MLGRTAGGRDAMGELPLRLDCLALGLRGGDCFLQVKNKAFSSTQVLPPPAFAEMKIGRWHIL